MANRKTILIFGISSFVGSSLVEILRENYRVVGTYYSTPIEISGIKTVKCDVLQKELVQRLIFLFKPDVTLYSVGLTNMMTCQEFPKLADAVNTAGVFNVSQASERYQSKLLFLSTSYVFSGEAVEFNEGDSPAPSTTYGKSKASAEFYIQKSCLNYIIFRCAPIFGHGINKDDPKFVEVLEREDFHKRRIVCDNRIKTGFLDVDTLAAVIHEALEQDIVNKLLQVSSPTAMTHYEFAKMYLSKKGGDVSLLTPGDWDFPVTSNSSSELEFKMDTSTIENELSLTIPDVDTMIDQYLTRMRGGNSAKILKLSR